MFFRQLAKSSNKRLHYWRKKYLEKQNWFGWPKKVQGQKGWVWELIHGNSLGKWHERSCSCSIGGYVTKKLSTNLSCVVRWLKLVVIGLSDGDDYLILLSRAGIFLRFVPPSPRSTSITSSSHSFALTKCGTFAREILWHTLGLRLQGRTENITSPG